MNKSCILKGGIFQLKSKANSLVEIIKVEDSQAKVSLYDENVSMCIIVDVSDLKGIALSIPILKSLGFEEKEGQLMGLPYEHYWQKQVNEHHVWIVDDEGIFKLAIVDVNAYFGVHFIHAHFLHELQNYIGHIDGFKLCKDIKAAIWEKE